uniref:Retrovirus-related Pol polyprotein from transposon TNT 1-94 n=1 Tax=Tanacetum cinerariifolium TaxID=118510 RepID=A0A6L2MXE7_TANCI|nr:retrovirus-related Pol polyprotein from transposon TNT 1-94 [Tanacetum cinerariifolium]
MMSFLSTVITSRFLTTNNWLRNSSNLRQQATIHDGRVTVQPVQGRQSLFATGTSRIRANTLGIGGNNSSQQRVMKCFNCQGEGHMARQCPNPKKKRDATWFRDKVLLVKEQGSGKVLNEEELEFFGRPWSCRRKRKLRILYKEIALEKKVKELENIVCKMGQSAQTVHMLMKQQVFYDNNLKQALGFENPFYLKKAQQIRPILYDDSVIAKQTNVISIANTEETLMLKEESRSKMLLKQSDPMVLEKKFNIKPINYAELNRLSKDFEVIAQESVVTKVYIRRPKVPKTNGSNSKPKIEKSVIFNKIEPNTSRGSNTSVAPSSSSYVDLSNDQIAKIMGYGDYQLMNFVSKFLGIVRFGNDQVAKIMGYGDYQLGNIAKIMGYGDYQVGNITISMDYYVEGLGHNLFSVGQFYDSDLEVAFKKHACFVRNLKGVDLLSGSQETNLYTLSIEDMIASSLICLLSKAQKTKYWLWHRRFSHLNFGAINHLAKNSLVRGLPKLKFEKDHMCSACVMGKSKKQSYKPKSKDTNHEKLYLSHMDLCGPMRVASINRKKYILVIVDDYSRFTWVKFLALKDEAPDFIIKFLKMIQVRLTTPVKNILIDNGTEFVNQTLCSYYESVSISHETLVVRSLQQNGVVESQNHTLVEAARTMLIYAKASLFLWVANAPRAVDLADSHVSTLIVQDASLTSMVNFMTMQRLVLTLQHNSCFLYSISDTGMSLTAYADADHAGCQDTRRSISESAQFLGDKLVSWSSKKQKITTISSTEPEYISLSRTMNPTTNEQIALDNTLVAPEARLTIGKCNSRISFSKPQNEATYQVYGVVIIKEMTNEDILNSTAYKTYDAYASGAKEHNKARKFKKRASPKLKTVPVSPNKPTKKPAKKTVPVNKSSKSQVGIIIKDTLGVSVSKKKAPVKGKRSKGIEILSDVALSEAAQLKEDTKRSKKDFHISQASGSGDGTDFESRVLDEQQRKTSGDSKDDDNDGDSEDDDNDDDSDDVSKDYEEEKHDEEYVQSPKNYESDDDKENMDEGGYDDLYKDVDVKSLRVEHEIEGKEDVEMTDTTHESASQETSYEQVVEDAHMTLTSSHKTEGSKQSSSVSSEFASKLLNLDNAPPVVDESTITKSLENVVLAKSSSQLKSTYEAAKSLIEFELKKILLDKLQKSKSETITTRIKIKTPAGSDQVLKKQKTSKDDGPPKGSKSKESMSSSSKGTKSQPKSSGKFMQADELVFETEDTEMLQDQGEKPPLTFDELMSTLIDFSTYVMHNFKIDNLTQEILVGLAFNLLKGTCKSFMELEYNFEECYKAVTDRLDWNNPKGHEYPFDRSKLFPLIEAQATHVKVMKRYGYGYLEEIIVRGKDQTLHKFKEGDFPRLNLRDIKDLLLLLVQKKLSNLEKDIIFDLNVALRMFTRRNVILTRVEDLQLGVKSYQKKLNITKPETFRSDITKMKPYTAYKNPQGIIYQDNLKRNSLSMDYLPKRSWSNLDRKRSRIMIKAIDQQLFERRFMRNFEKFVGGREYKNDFRLLNG